VSAERKAASIARADIVPAMKSFRIEENDFISAFSCSTLLD